MTDTGLVVAIYRQEASDGVDACTIIEHLAGPKRYARVWDDDPMRVEWGWNLHPTSARIYPLGTSKSDERERRTPTNGSVGDE